MDYNVYFNNKLQMNKDASTMTTAITYSVNEVMCAADLIKLSNTIVELRDEHHDCKDVSYFLETEHYDIYNELINYDENNEIIEGETDILRAYHKYIDEILIEGKSWDDLYDIIERYVEFIKMHETTFGILLCCSEL